MQSITFITGNPKKADYLEKYLGFPIEHTKLDLDEIQSLDLYEVVEHKVKQAYEKIWKPILVEDASLVFLALGRLPGTFIRFFIEEMDENTLCSLIDGKDRSALASTLFGYYDGTKLAFFYGSHPWTIAESPRGDNGYGWDRIFIPDGYSGTRAELSEVDHATNYMEIKPLQKVRDFLMTL